MGTEGNTFTSLLAMILNCPGDLGPIHRCIAQVFLIYVCISVEGGESKRRPDQYDNVLG